MAVSHFFAGISGSGPADVAALGLILIPAMVEAGFSKRFSAALMAAGGGIGIIVPPSIALILYGVVAQDSAPSVSISKLFIAGIVPGILVGLCLIVYILLFQKPSDSIRPKRCSSSRLARESVSGGDLGTAGAGDYHRGDL